MNAANRHTVELQDDTFREMADEALKIFDAYFGREDGVEWDVTEITAGVHVVLRDGAGQELKRTWEAMFTAELRTVSIGTPNLEHAMTFR